MRTWCACSALLVAIVCGINLAHVAHRTPPPPRMPAGVPANLVLRHEQRFAPLRSALQTHAVRGAVGYVADLPPDRLATDAKGMEEYFLSQFVLVPWVLDPRLGDCRWAVANLRSGAAAGRLPVGFHIVGDFGGGVLLLQKGRP